MNRKLIVPGVLITLTLLIAVGAYSTLQLLAEPDSGTNVSSGGGRVMESVTESGEVKIVQEIRSVSDAGELKEQMEVQVWGERRGDRVVATVVVFGPLAGGAFE